MYPYDPVVWHARIDIRNRVVLMCAHSCCKLAKVMQLDYAA